MKKPKLIDIVNFHRYQAMIFSILALLFSYWFFIRTGLGQTIDTLGMFALHFLNKKVANWEYLFLKRYFWYGLIFIVAIIVFIILYRKIYKLGLSMVVMGAVATITTQVLKHWILERPSLGITYYIDNSFPSGHTTTASIIAVILVVVCTDRWKNTVALLSTLISTSVAIAVIVARWHRGADILGGILVVLIMVLVFYHPEKDKTSLPNQVKFTYTALKIGFFGFVLSAILMAICCLQIHVLKIDKNIGLAFDQIVNLAKLHSHLALLSAVALIIMVLSMALILSYTVVRISQKSVLDRGFQ